MTDPSSQNPSDPANQPDSGDLGPEKKLKLKQLLKPLTPHLNVEQREQTPKAAFNEFKPKLEIPRAEPIEPEPELAPHERPPSMDGTPLPTGAASPGLGGLPHPPPQTAHDPSLLNPLETTQPEVETPTEAAEEPQEDEIEELVSAPAPKPNRIRKIALPVMAVIVVLAAVHFIFDPLGLSIESIGLPQPVAVQEQQDPIDNDDTPANLAPVTLTLELENISVESFLGQLEQQSIITSNRPRGAIIDSVFYSEGSTLNPMLGLVLDTVHISGKDSNIEIIDGSGNRYEFSAK